MKFKKQYIAFILALIVVLILGRNCGHAAPVTNRDTLKTEIKKAEVKRDSLRPIIIFQDRVRDTIIYRWRTVRHDSLIPCEEKLVICDTIIRVDSALISSLKAGRRIDSTIIANQDLIIQNDSLTISDLTKSVKKEKRKSWFKGFKAGFITGNITGFVGSQLTKR